MSVHTSSTEARADRRRHHDATADALNWHAPWTPDQDAELRHGRGTVAQRAARLGRTYYAACYRLSQLRKQERDAARQTRNQETAA